MKHKLLIFPFAALLSVAAIFAACGDDDDDATNTPAVTPAVTSAAATATASPSEGDGAPTLAEAEAYYEGVIETFNGGDIEGALAAFNDEALAQFTQNEPGTPREEMIAQALDFLSGGVTITITDVTEHDSTDDSITIQVVSDDGSTVSLEHYLIERDGDDLVITGFESLDAEVPDGTTLLTVEGTEYQYIVSDEATDGNLAFEFSNIGSQIHEMLIVPVDATTPIDQIAADSVAAGDEFPESVLGPPVVGAFAPPGDSMRVVLVDPLDAGRYMMICFIPDQSVPEGEGEAHATLGMFEELIVP